MASAGLLALAEDKKPILMEKVVVSEQAKTHTLFMGADLAITLNKVSYPVKSVRGSDWVIEIDGRERRIPTKGSPLDLKIVPTLKLTEVSAKLDGFNKVPAYSYENDPSVRLTKGLMESAKTNAMLTGIALDAQHLADTESVNANGLSALGGAGALASSNNQFGSNALMYTAQISSAVTHPPPAVAGSITPPSNPTLVSTFGGGNGNTLGQKLANQDEDAAAAQAANGNEPEGRLATRGFDAMDVNFDVSSVKPLREPYVVTLARFRTPDMRPGMVRTLVYAKSLDPIDARPASIHFSEEGFPFNYELVDFQVHLYNAGVEVATNVAQKRVELTREEAFQYVLIEYLSAHRHDTLQASPAMGKLPADLSTQLALGRYNGTFYVKVAKDGSAEQPYTDMFCTQKINDSYLERVLAGLYFKPALADGKPVEGVAPVNLRTLSF
jgi:hypothetical protein